MTHKLFTLLLLGFIAVAGFGCGGDDDNGVVPPGPTPPPRIVAAPHQDPGLASVDHAVWDSITAVQVPVGTDNDYNANLGFRTDLFANMKALVAGTYLYVRVEWNDTDEDNRFGPLRAYWLNNRVQWEQVDTTLFANEDRFYMLFDNGGPNGADCASMCHASANASGNRFYGAAGDDADIWHWKAHRTGLAGFAEDMNLTTSAVVGDAIDAATDTLYFRNWNSQLGHPYKMHEDTTAYVGPGLLENEYVTFEADDNNLPWVPGITQNPPDSTGLYLPGYYLNNISGVDGERWDVNATSDHDGINWTIVFRRSLNTGDANDVIISAGDSVAISIAVADNSYSNHHGREPFYLILQ